MCTRVCTYEEGGAGARSQDCPVGLCSAVPQGVNCEFSLDGKTATPGQDAFEVKTAAISGVEQGQAYEQRGDSAVVLYK